MKLNQGDYLIISIGDKPHLAKCVHTEDKSYKAILEKDKLSGGDLVPVDFKARDVLTNLGKSPKPGKVYGVSVEPLHKQITSKFWGEVRLYLSLNDEQQEALKHELSVAAKRFRELNLNVLKLEVEIRQRVGKRAGFYKLRPKSETDIFCVKPEPNMEGIQYVIAHEYGHGIWGRCLGNKMKFRWIEAYHNLVTLNEVSQKRLARILEDIQGAGSVADYLKDCEDKDTLVVKSCLKHIKNIHGLDKRHLETALRAGEKLDNYWPTFIELSEKEQLLTEYAKSDPEEFFAEAFALWFTGKKLPKSVESLRDLTMRKLNKASAE